MKDLPSCLPLLLDPQALLALGPYPLSLPVFGRDTMLPIWLTWPVLFVLYDAVYRKYMWAFYGTWGTSSFLWAEPTTYAYKRYK